MRHMMGELLSVLLYLFVGIVSLTMAYRNLFSERLLAFHEKLQESNGISSVRACKRSSSS